MRVAIKIVDKKDAVFDAESLEQEVRIVPMKHLTWHHDWPHHLV